MSQKQILIEYKNGPFTVHFNTEHAARKNLESLGFKWDGEERSVTDLHMRIWQHIYFQNPKTSESALLRVEL